MSWYGPCERAVYYSQRNNLVAAAKQCMPTAVVTMLAASGVKMPPTPGEQPEDALSRFAESDPRVRNYMEAKQGWAVRLGWPPYTEHNTLAHATNLWIGLDVVRYSMRRPLEAIVADLAAGRCSAVTGRFTPGGHVVCMIGVETEQWLEGGPRPDQIDLRAVKRFMLHDPWGDWHTGYADHNGARCLYTVDELIRLLMVEGKPDKWAIYLQEGGNA